MRCSQGERVEAVLDPCAMLHRVAASQGLAPTWAQPAGIYLCKLASDQARPKPQEAQSLPGLQALLQVLPSCQWEERKSESLLCIFCFKVLSQNPMSVGMSSFSTNVGQCWPYLLQLPLPLFLPPFCRRGQKFPNCAHAHKHVGLGGEGTVRPLLWLADFYHTREFWPFQPRAASIQPPSLWVMSPVVTLGPGCEKAVMWFQFRF